MDRLDKDVVHEICTNQVVVTLHACVKELVENSLDAGATRIEVRLRESGSELLELVDNGCGISPEDYEKVAVRHATSKIREYADLSQTLATFGFRGEALAAICAMGDMTVCTRTAKDPVATLLVYDRFGKLTSRTPAAREVGTTVSVRELFKRLPVRHREFLRNAKAQVSSTLRLIQAYAIAQPEIRFHVVAEKARGHSAGRSTLLCTSGTAVGWRQAAASVLGDPVVAEVVPLEIQNGQSGWVASGLISTPTGGRRARDVQLFFVNRRPVDPPKRIAKLINDTYHQYNSKLYPAIIVSFSAPQGLVDVNVTPDKRTVFLHNEEALLADLQQALTLLWAPASRGPGATLATFGIQRPASSVDLDLVPYESQPLTAPAPAPLTPVMAPAPLADAARTPEGGGAHRQYGLTESDSLETPDKEPELEMSIYDSGSAVPYACAPTPSSPSRPPPPSPARSQSLPGRPGPPVEEAPPEKRARPDEGEAAGGRGGGERGVLVVDLDPPAADAARPVDAAADRGDRAAGALAAPAAAGPAPAPAAAWTGGCSVFASVSLADLEAAAARRRAAYKQRATDARGLPVAAAVHFPEAFSLSSLQAGARAVEEVARFQTPGRPSDAAAFKFDRSCFAQMRVIGQFNLGFVIAALQTQPRSAGQRDDDDDPDSDAGGDGLQLFIVDQHASDEKFRFEGLNRDSKIDRQPLVALHPLQLTPAQEAIAMSNLEIFRLNGFDLSCDDSRPPGRRLRLAALPTCQGLVFGEKDILELISAIEETEAEHSRPSVQDASAGSGGLLDLAGHRGLWSAAAVPRPPKVWQLLACRACRGAIMIGKALRVAEMEKILTNLGELQQPWNCPHGRPTLRHLVDAGVARKAPRRPPPLAELLRSGPR